MIALCAMLTLCSCTVHPFSYDPNTGVVTSLGASVGTKSADESAYAYTPAGSPMGYHIAGKDETSIPKGYFWEKGITNVSGNILNGFRTAQSTDRIISRHGVQEAGINAARDVRLSEIANPIEPVAEAAAALP